ncbi:MAG: rhomboid family intramembrane serine protease [Sphingobacteriia bacterium]
MAAFVDDIRHRFIPTYGAIGWLIVINVGVYVALSVAYVLLFLLGQQHLFYTVYGYLALPTHLASLLAQPWSLFTYMWVHDMRTTVMGSVFHILFNMLWLYWVGGRILRPYQPDRRIWFLFVAGALCGACLTLLAYNLLPVFAGQRGTMVGASAGVTAIMVAAATLLPNTALHLLFFGTVRLVWLVAAFLFIDFLSIAMSGNKGGVIAHLGGALFGYLYMRSVKSGHDWGQPFFRLFSRRRRRSPLKIVAKKKAGVPQTGTYAGKPGKPSQAEVDRILDKIAKVGYEKLTQEEKQILFDASRA